MKICLDITCLAVDNWTGVQNAYYSLISELVRNNKKEKFIVFAMSPRGLKSKLESLNINQNPNVTTVILPIPSSFFTKTLSLLQKSRLPILNLFINAKLDVYLSGGYFWLPIKSKFSICTIFDTCEGSDDIEKQRLIHASKHADHFITSSSASKLDIHTKLKIPKDNISLIPLGLETDRFNKIDAKPVETLQNQNFFIAFGSAKRKNIKNIKKAHKKSKVKEKIFVIGGNNYVTDEQMKWLWENTSGLIYASTCEGFGLPILEAYRYGKPVLTSKISCMPEVAGDAAIYCDPYAIDSISKGIKTLSKSKLNISKSKKQLNKYSYKKSARKLIEIINENTL